MKGWLEEGLARGQEGQGPAHPGQGLGSKGLARGFRQARDRPALPDSLKKAKTTLPSASSS